MEREKRNAHLLDAFLLCVHWTKDQVVLEGYNIDVVDCPGEGIVTPLCDPYYFVLECRSRDLDDAFLRSG